MFWTVALICLVHKSEASLPSIAEIMARSRWCLGEGGKCPINFPQRFPSCCKPFICTEIQKTRTPTRFLKFSEYKDYRCLLPANVTTTAQPSQIEDLIPTVLWSQEDNEGPVPLSTYMNSSVEVGLENNSSSHVESEESQLSSNSPVEVSSQEIDDGNDYKFDTANDTRVDYETTSPNEDLSGNDLNGTETKFIVKRSILNESNYFEEDSGFVAPFNVSNAINQTFSFVSSEESLPTNETSEELEQPEEAPESVQVHKTSAIQNGQFNSSEYYSEQKGYDGVGVSNSTLDKSPNLSGTKTSPNDILYSSVEDVSLISTTPSTLLTNITRTDESEEDWHSSQMKYDTRPRLHKVITIPPFHLSNFFQSVEVVQLNASVENSLDG
ncbi:uncharacterized protein LOC124361917 isoform X1 [Homalodisca vitripennis]|uniref:uncharacterized protein LOC124361917 isoform X1 n=1 Tax=Homalodisca vitripennis TaxID=197043 RepID=UPI001EECA44E|nr:uncharacterized protein LOC124361917 isoform X1 [Homalodisca vitripennis]